MDLISSFSARTLSQDDLKLGGVIVKGIIICNRCREKMNGVCKCKSLKKRKKARKPNYKCLIQVYWKGKHYEYRRDDQGYVFTYDKAKDKLAEISTAMKKGRFNPADFSDANINERKFRNQIEEWLSQKEEEEKTNELSPETLRCYRSYNKNYFSFFLGWDVREIGFEQLERFKDKLPRRISLKMKRNILNCLHGFFVWLKRKGVIKEVPTWPQIKGDDAQVRYAIDLKDQNDALAKMPSEWKDAFIFLFETGLRIGELCALKIKDIDFKNGRALIQRTWSGVKLVETTKGRNKRWIPLSDQAYEIAKKHVGVRWPEEFLLVNPTTKRGYRQEFLRRKWHAHSKLNITLYEASRHSFCTQIVENGASLLEAKQLMRHSDIRSTERYFHGSIAKMKDIVNKRGKIIPLIVTEKQESK